MIKKLFIFSALALVASALFVTSCKKDCSFNQKDYVGSYFVDEDCSTSAPVTYEVNIVAGATETDLKLSNVWDAFGASVNATIDCEVITIARQEPDGDKYFVEGSGTIDKTDGVTTITLNYTVTNEAVTPAEVDNCSTTFVQN